MNPLKLSVGQLCSTDQVSENLKQIKSQYDQLVNQDLFLLPENALAIRISKKTEMPVFDLNSDVFLEIQSWVEQKKNSYFYWFCSHSCKK